MSDVIGLCAICGNPPAIHTCHLCGQLICPRCYDSRHGICVRCQPGKKML